MQHPRHSGLLNPIVQNLSVVPCFFFFRHPICGIFYVIRILSQNIEPKCWAKFFLQNVKYWQDWTTFTTKRSYCRSLQAGFVVSPKNKLFWIELTLKLGKGLMCQEASFRAFANCYMICCWYMICCCATKCCKWYVVMQRKASSIFSYIQV